PVGLAGCAQAARLPRDPNRPRCAGGCVVTHAHAEIVPIPQHRDPAHLRDGLFDQPEALGGKNRRVVGNASDVAARMRQAVDKARRDRITGSDVNHRRDIRDLAGECGWKAANYKDVDLVPAFMARTISPSLPVWPPAPRGSNARFLPSV